MTQEVSLSAVQAFLTQLQDNICQELESLDGQTTFKEEAWTSTLGSGRTRVMSRGKVFEQAGVNFSHVSGKSLPPSATAQRPELAGQPFQAMGVSLVIHPRNPHVPTTHMNVRLFSGQNKAGEAVWWFGGGFDLTPYLPVLTDCVDWHQHAKRACDPFGESLYPKFKAEADQYFYLPHRDETRGIGGLFYDDFQGENFEHAFGLTRSIGETFMRAYAPIVSNRYQTPYDDSDRQFQKSRRGRYVEFNLLYDRGTLFGLQSRGRTASILMSLPPEVSWSYDDQDVRALPACQRLRSFLKPHDWLSLSPSQVESSEALSFA